MNRTPTDHTNRPPTGHAHSVLANREVHVWLAALDAAADADAGVELLSTDERELAGGFAREQQRRRWRRSRGVLRLLLGGYLNADPAKLRFEPDERGKPRLAGEGAWLDFNISHSGGLALYAVGRKLSVGVDIETLGGQRDWVAIAGRAFGTAVARRLASLDQAERGHEFLRLWVRHEARRKCSGLGLWREDDDAAGEPMPHWEIELDLSGDRAVAALAAQAEPVQLRLWRWRPGAGGPVGATDGA